MLHSIEGTFRDGRVELAETPLDIAESRVIVTFLGPGPGNGGPPASVGQPLIVDRGRGPQIASSRITIYDIMDYRVGGWDVRQIAEWFRLREDEVTAAFRYIDEHKAEVETTYQEIVERSARGNPPEIQSQMAESRRKIREWYQARGKPVPPQFGE
jgi:uncharacterized protein (DUF433 family)